MQSEQPMMAYVFMTRGMVPQYPSAGSVCDRYTSNISSGEVFYTDANGREMQKRTRNARPSWNLTVTEPVSGNYYPLTAAMYLEVVAPSGPLSPAIHQMHIRLLVQLLATPQPPLGNRPAACAVNQDCRCMQTYAI